LLQNSVVEVDDGGVKKEKNPPHASVFQVNVDVVDFAPERIIEVAGSAIPAGTHSRTNCQNGSG
jgi:hypothetical protein